jgi:predicted hydrolase (HD superfamily)
VRCSWIQSGCRKTAKKTKDKAFARSVNRQDILDGAQELGVPLEDHIDFCVKAMQANAEALGLKGV